MHGEKCLICKGTGKVGTWPEQWQCHGCCGKGWVEVSDGPNDVSEEFWPAETTELWPIKITGGYAVSC